MVKSSHVELYHSERSISDRKQESVLFTVSFMSLT